MFREFIKDTFLFDVLFTPVQSVRLLLWLAKKKPIPPPPAYKQYTVKRYAQRYKLDTLVETGTYLGDMIYACRNTFKKIYSIELGDEFYKKAVNRFQKKKNVSLCLGDSGTVLRSILNDVHAPCLFWLDAHYWQEVGTARGLSETPIMQEIACILNHDVKNHIILIDDARCFNGTHDYPTIAELGAYVQRCRPDLELINVSDLIRITKKNT